MPQDKGLQRDINAEVDKRQREMRKWRGIDRRLIGEFGGLDELGYSRSGLLPRWEIAQHIQMQSERAVAQRNARLAREAAGVFQGGLAQQQAYRPGGLASTLFPYYSGIAQSTLAGRTQAPDLTYDLRRQLALKERKRARNDAILGMVGGLLGGGLKAVGGALAGGGQTPSDGGGPTGGGFPGLGGGGGPIGPLPAGGGGTASANFGGGDGVAAGTPTGGGVAGGPGGAGGGGPLGGGGGAGPTAGPGQASVAGPGAGGAGGGPSGGPAPGPGPAAGGAAPPQPGGPQPVGGPGPDLGAAAYSTEGVAAQAGPEIGLSSSTMAALSYDLAEIDDTWIDEMSASLDVMLMEILDNDSERVPMAMGAEGGF